MPENDLPATDMDEAQPLIEAFLHEDIPDRFDRTPLFRVQPEHKRAHVDNYDDDMIWFGDACYDGRSNGRATPGQGNRMTDAYTDAAGAACQSKQK